MTKIVGLAQFISELRPPKYVLRPFLQRGYVYALTAHTNHGKTALVHYWILKRVTGRVLLLCGENPDDSRARMYALAEHLKLDLAELDKRVYVWAGANKLRDILGSVISQANKIGEFDLVVVDTSAAYFSYEDENDNVQARQHAQDCRVLTESIAGHPCTLIPCHPAKASSQDSLTPRGGSGFNGEIDCNLTLHFDGEIATLHHIKIRGPAFEPQTYRMVPYTIQGIADEEGGAIESVVCEALNEAQEAVLSARRTEDENLVLFAMKAAPEAAMASWARACGWQGNKAKVHRILLRLEPDKLVRKYRGRWELTPKGVRECSKDTP